MSIRIAAINRGKAASREATPTHSRAASRVPSCEVLNVENVIINHVVDNLPTNLNNSLLHPPPRESDEGSQNWRDSSGNLTSSDSSPSSENTADSGQPTDSSPLTARVTSLGFLPNTADNSPYLYRMPIIGYEVVEERSKFTVFKIQVFHRPTEDNWFVFRRYTDFVRLNKTLRKEFPGLRFALPPKKWFGDNFDPMFLEDRQLGLQAFIDNIIGHTVIREKKCVRDFFCLDDPLGAHDTLEESRAVCQSLEETVSDLQEQLREKEGEVAMLRSQVNFLMVQQQTLVKALRLECDMKSPMTPLHGSTHDLNLALLNICERTLNGSLNNANHKSPGRNGANGFSGNSSPARRVRVNSLVESPLRRTLEKAFIPRSGSHNTLSLGRSSDTTLPNDNGNVRRLTLEGEGDNR